MANFLRGLPPFEIDNLMQTDWYKITEMYLAWTYYRPYWTQFAHINRHQHVRFAEIVGFDEAKRQFDHVQSMRVTPDAVDKIAAVKSKITGKRVFRDESFLKFLRFDFHLSPLHLDVEKDTGQFIIDSTGPWITTGPWEIPMMKIPQGSYTRARLKLDGKTPEYFMEKAKDKLLKTIATLKSRPGLRWMYFGPRRAAFSEWEVELHKILFDAYAGSDQFLGTSHCDEAFKRNKTPLGTQGHVSYMITGAVNSPSPQTLFDTQYEVLENWERLMPPEYLWALSDTWGTRAFWKVFGPHFAKRWLGTRPDSGNIEHNIEESLFNCGKYKVGRNLGVVLSDGMTDQTSVDAYDKYSNMCATPDGIGTWIGNNSIYEPVSHVAKALWASASEHSPRYWTCKLTNNPSKIICADPTGETQKYYQQVFEYNPADYEAEDPVF